MIYLRDDFKKLWTGKEPFQEVDKLTGEIFRNMNNRKTLRFEINNKSYFLKLHKGIGWKEILKALSQLKIPILGASNEYNALIKLKKLDIDTMTPVAYGNKGANPATLHSFIITEDLINTESLEDFCKDWAKNPPDLKLKQIILDRIANVSNKLHSNGMNHRDYYLCHFHINTEIATEKITKDNLKLHLIDLHRMQIRNKVPIRWIIKDIGGLYFSAMDIGLTQKDIFRFMKIYKQKSLRQTLKEDSVFWEKVKTNAKMMYEKHS